MVSFETLTVKLSDGSTYYFPAGGVTDDPSPRIENLRFAIDNGTIFRSVDESGVEREFSGYDVTNYHLA